MGYHISIENVETWRATLQQIYDNAVKNEVTIIETDFPREARWHILQAMKSAEKLEVEPFCRLTVRIVKRGARALVVYPKFIPSSIGLTLHAASTELAKPQYGVSSMLALVTSTLQAKDSFLSFPDLEPSLLEKATAWAETMGHQIVSKDPFTIRKKESL